MTKSKNEIYIAIGSRNFFGAEKRLFRIVNFIIKNSREIKTILIINSSLYVACQSSRWSKSLLQELDKYSLLVVIPDSPLHLLKTKRLEKLFDAIFSKTPLHSALRARHLSYIKGIIGRPASIEVTSPDTANQVYNETSISILKRLKSVHCVSSTVASKLSALIDSNHRGHISNNVNISFYSTPYFERDSDVNYYEEKKNSIVSASRFIHRKNVILVAKALDLALPKLPDWTASILCQGEDKEKIQAILRPWIDSGRVSVRHEQSVETVLKKSKIYISLIEPDNYPSQAVLEAMNYGNALIVSDTGQSHIFIDNNRNGVLVSLDVKDIADAIVSVCQNQALLEMGTASNTYLKARFSARRHVEELLQIHGLAL